MAMLSVIGDQLDGSGWIYVMASATVTTDGQALGLQKGSHTSRSQWAHQVTAAALCIGFLTGHMWNIVPSHKTMRKSTSRSGANIWHQNTMLQLDFYSCSSLDHNIGQHILILSVATLSPRSPGINSLAHDQVCE